MKKLSTGDDSTLGNWLKLVKTFMGEDCPAAQYLQQKIDNSPNGADEEVIADEPQLLHTLANMNRAKV